MREARVRTQLQREARLYFRLLQVSMKSFSERPTVSSSYSQKHTAHIMKTPIAHASRFSRTARLCKLNRTIITGIALATASAIFLHAEDAPKIEVELDPVSAIVLKKGINGFPENTKVISTTCNGIYTLAPVVDGIKKRKELDWLEGSWASIEDDDTHAIEVQLGKPLSGGRFQITWAYDHDDYKFSRSYVIQVKDKADGVWKNVIWVKDNQSIVSSYALPKEPFSFIRIAQPKGGGPDERANILWVGQIEITD
jgi:hypothetical protein